MRVFGKMYPVHACDEGRWRPDRLGLLGTEARDTKDGVALGLVMALLAGQLDG
jgi:hypothetical protein